MKVSTDRWVRAEEFNPLSIPPETFVFLYCAPSSARSKIREAERERDAQGTPQLVKRSVCCSRGTSAGWMRAPEVFSSNACRPVAGSGICHLLSFVPLPPSHQAASRQQGSISREICSHHVPPEDQLTARGGGVIKAAALKGPACYILTRLHQTLLYEF